jgi:hypothetical protein
MVVLLHEIQVMIKIFQDQLYVVLILNNKILMQDELVMKQQQHLLLNQNQQLQDLMFVSMNQISKRIDLLLHQHLIVNTDHRQHKKVYLKKYLHKVDLFLFWALVLFHNLNIVYVNV